MELRNSASSVLRGTLQGLVKGGEEEEGELFPRDMSMLHCEHGVDIWERF